MSEIDIRTNTSPPVTTIKFADDDTQCYATSIVNNGNGIRLEDCGGCCEGDVRKSDIPNFILALQKAQSIGWIK